MNVKGGAGWGKDKRTRFWSAAARAPSMGIVLTTFFLCSAIASVMIFAWLAGYLSI